eukprot:30957-Pelagococcus_subviridis.AAC.34
MSAALQPAVAALRARSHRASHPRHVRASASRIASRRPASISCAATAGDAVKDKRVPVTILTGFLGCVKSSSPRKQERHLRSDARGRDGVAGARAKP